METICRQLHEFVAGEKSLLSKSKLLVNLCLVLVLKENSEVPT